MKSFCRFIRIPARRACIRWQSFTRERAVLSKNPEARDAADLIFRLRPSMSSPHRLRTRASKVNAFLFPSGTIVSSLVLDHAWEATDRWIQARNRGVKFGRAEEKLMDINTSLKYVSLNNLCFLKTHIPSHSYSPSTLDAANGTPEQIRKAPSRS